MSGHTPKVVSNGSLRISYMTLRMLSEVYHHYEAGIALDRYLRMQATGLPKHIPYVIYNPLVDNYVVNYMDAPKSKTWNHDSCRVD